MDLIIPLNLPAKISEYGKHYHVNDLQQDKEESEIVAYKRTISQK